ncbi:MAG: hypothetical protein ACKVS6_11405 [Planctomycetota bacterium]
MTSHAYSLEHYILIIDKARASGYEFVRMQDLLHRSRPKRFMFIRHDVDITPWAALAMAELEHSQGVATSYYFRLHALTYNLLSREAAEVVRLIEQLGHEVGLHYEPGFFMELGRDPVEGVRNDIRIFEELLGKKTYTIAQHQPAQRPLLLKYSQQHRCAYEPEFVREIPYFADSGFHWREGCICTKIGKLPQIHTLIHPHSWTEKAQPWREVLRMHAGDLSARLSNDMEAYISSVEQYLHQRSELDRAREGLYHQYREKNG